MLFPLHCNPMLCPIYGARYNGSGAPMTDELLGVGRRLGAALEALDKRVAVVISSDLAHTHLASGPCGGNA